jgi:hypothetical protein
VKNALRYVRFAVLPPLGSGEKPTGVLHKGETVAGSLLLNNATIVRIWTDDNDPRHTGRKEAELKVRELGFSPRIFKVLD